MFYSIYDLLIYKTKEMGKTQDEMFGYFRNCGIKKQEIMVLKDNCSMASIGSLRQPILDYLQMTGLELNMALGIIPREYQKSYFNQILEISKLLEIENTETYKNEQKSYFTTNNGALFNKDCIEYLKSVEDDTVNLIFADPPFNLNKIYDEGVNDDLSTSEYLNWCFKWIDQCIRILKPGGSICIYNIPKWSTYFSEYLNKQLTFRSWISVDMKYSLPIAGRLSPSHYALLYYVKGEKPTVFNNPRIQLQTCRHCGGEIKDYGGYKNKMNPLGVNVSDVWYDIFPVRHKNTKNRQYNELSVKLLDRIISMTTNEGDLVLDPFGGSGTTYIVSELLNRKWAGAEIGNCDIIVDRFKNIDKDRKILDNIHEDKDLLFSESVKKLRRKNGFWLSEDFQNNF